MPSRTTTYALVLASLWVAWSGDVGAQTAPPGAEYSPEIARVEAYLGSIYPEDEPGAAILIVRDGQVLFRDAFGLADVESGRSLTPDDVFHVASITKNITAAAILQLAERGVLSLDDEVASHLPEVPAAWEGITIRHLLSHTSGIAEFTELLPDDSSYVHHDTLFARVTARPLLSAPGEEWAYSNSGYLLLGLIVERHSGQPWGEYVERHFYEPLGMRSTVYAGRNHPRLVPGHRKVRERFRRAVTPLAIPYAAGATLSTVDDLARWIAAVEKGEVLSDAARHESVRRVQMSDGTTSSYGMGWSLSPFGPHEVQWHGGDITGYASMMLRIPEERLLVIVLSNNEHARERPMFVALRAAELILGEDWSQRVEVGAEMLQPLAGTYRSAEGKAYLVKVEGGRLFYITGGTTDRTELLPLSATEFVGEMGIRFHFERREGIDAARVLLRPVFGKEEVAHRVP